MLNFYSNCPIRARTATSSHSGQIHALATRLTGKDAPLVIQQEAGRALKHNNSRHVPDSQTECTGTRNFLTLLQILTQWVTSQGSSSHIQLFQAVRYTSMANIAVLGVRERQMAKTIDYKSVRQSVKRSCSP
jgi:hypothetical protein